MKVFGEHVVARLICALSGVVLSSFLQAAGNAFRVTPYLQHPATNAMSVLWFAETNGDARISWWPEGGGVTNAASISPEFAGDLVYTDVDTNQFASLRRGPILPCPWKYRCRIGGLRPGTRYGYAVALSEGVVYTNAFRTAPGRDSPVRIICYSDCETEPESTGKFDTYWNNPANEAARAYYVDQTEGFASNIVRMVERRPDFIAIAGDLVQYGYEQRDWDEFWRHQAGVYNDPAGSIPIIASPGNHDSVNSGAGESGLDGGLVGMRRWTRYFEVEENDVVYHPSDLDFVDDPEYARIRRSLFHRLDYGRVTWICLDSNNGDDRDPLRDSCLKFYTARTAPRGTAPAVAPDFNPGSRQYMWLTNQLADAQARGQFIFVSCHHMPYSVGYHNRTNGVSYAGYVEPYSSIALRVLTPTFLKYGVTAWIAGHDEIMEHSRVFGPKTLPNGRVVAGELNLFDVGNSGDGLRGGGPKGGPYLCEYANPHEVFRAHVDAPEIFDVNGVMVDGGKHYGHLEINVAPNARGRWECTFTPVYVFVAKDERGRLRKFERRVFDDVMTLDENGRRVEKGRPAARPWYHDPRVQARVVSLGEIACNTHYMNKDAGDRLLCVNHSASERRNALELYSLARLVSLTGTVNAVDDGVALARVTPRTLWGEGEGDQWKGCAVSADGSFAIAGLGAGATTRYTAFRADLVAADGGPTQTWKAGETAFSFAPDGSCLLDGLDFSPRGEALYSNDYSQRKLIHRWTWEEGFARANDGRMGLAQTFTSILSRIRNVSAHTIRGRELLYYGEGARTASSARVCVLDATDPDAWREVVLTNAPALFRSDIMNVKLSGSGTREPLLHVTTDHGQIHVFRLSHDGFRLLDQVAALAPEQVGALCGLAGAPTKFRNFEVLEDGSHAFLCVDAVNGNACRSDLCVIGEPPSRGTVLILR